MTPENPTEKALREDARKIAHKAVMEAGPSCHQLHYADRAIDALFDAIHLTRPPLAVSETPSDERNRAMSVPLWLAEDLLSFCRANAELPKRETMVPIGSINAFAALIPTHPEPSPDEHPATYQSRVDAWLRTAFQDIPEVVGDKEERNRRFAEEACELLHECDFDKAHMLATVEWVFGQARKDSPRIEIGDVSNTLAALATAHGVDMNEAREETMARCWANIDKMQAKWATKPKFDEPPANSAGQGDGWRDMQKRAAKVADEYAFQARSSQANNVKTDAVLTAGYIANGIRALAPPTETAQQDSGEVLGRFGHHPDARTDYDCEIDALIGMAYDRLTGMEQHPDFEGRICRAMDFRVIERPGALRWLSQVFNGTREIYAVKPDWVQWPEDKLAAYTHPTPPIPAERDGGEVERRAKRWAGVIELVEQITEEEGATVTFTGPNPDFNRLPNEAVTVCGGPIWKERTYRGDTLEDCLRAALTPPKPVDTDTGVR